LDSSRSGYDAIIQGESGFTFMNGEPDSPPTKLPVALMDLLAAHQLKEGLLLALLKRDRTGRGDYVSVSLMQSGIASLANQAANWQVGGSIPTRMGSDHPNIAPYGTLFTTADDKEIVLAIGSDKQFAKLCSLLGRPDLSRDPCFIDNQSRVKNRDLLKKKLKDLIHLKNRDPFLEELAQNVIPAGAVNNMREVLNTPEARAIVLEGQMIDGQTMRGLRNAVFTSRDPEIFRKDIPVPPHFGEHSRCILTTLLSMNPDEINRLCRQGIVHAP
jgi:crotonobetainyl-CoA:carnitine CoA-transferase CaiB-like acyl-CoA transferase